MCINLGLGSGIGLVLGIGLVSVAIAIPFFRMTVFFHKGVSMVIVCSV